MKFCHSQFDVTDKHCELLVTCFSVEIKQSSDYRGQYTHPITVKSLCRTANLCWVKPGESLGNKNILTLSGIWWW